MIIINPGSGPVAQATERAADDALAVFIDDLRERNITITGHCRQPANDDGDGRFAYQLTADDGRIIDVDMPGISVDQVRWMGLPEQNIWDFPRLYIDGSSWVWHYALRACEPQDEETP